MLGMSALGRLKQPEMQSEFDTTLYDIIMKGEGVRRTKEGGENGREGRKILHNGRLVEI